MNVASGATRVQEYQPASVKVIKGDHGWLIQGARSHLLDNPRAFIDVHPMAFKSSAAAPPSAIAALRVDSRTQNEGELSQHVAPEQAVLVFVSRSAFHRVWFALVFAHALCAAFVACVAAVYVYAHGCYIMNALTIYEVVVAIEFLPHVAAMYVALAGIHVWLLWDILVRSIRSRTYSLRRVSTVRGSHPSSRLVQSRPLAYAKATQQLTKLADAAMQWCPSLVASALDSTWRFLIASRAAMDVRHHNYNLFFLVRKFVQSSLQTYQAYRLSCLVPRVWMNNVMVALLVLNCWSTPLLKYIFPPHTGKLRLGCALVSISLDFMAHAVIPVVIFLPYLLQFNFDTQDFDPTKWYTEVWLIQTINELQLLFVTSFWDAVSKFMVATSIARWLYTITKLVTVAPLAPVSVFAGVRSMVSVVPSDSLHCSRQPPSLHQPAAWKHRFERVGSRVLLLWGCVILGAHLHAASLPVYPQCLLRTRPWFGSKPSCSLLGYDCLLEKSTGSEQDLDQFLQLFDEARTGFLCIRRCPALSMPPRLQTLSGLRGLKLYQCTILTWDSRTALTNSRHPEMLFVFLVDVNMTELPQGLQSTDFPKKLSDIEMYGSNVSRLPDSLASIWPSDMFLIVENCQFQQVPSAIPLLKPRFLSLALNSISSVPADLLDPAAPACLFLDGNPIQTLPANLTNTPPTFYLSFRGTQVASLPNWIDEQYLAGAMVLAGGTPLCDRMIQMGKASASTQMALLGIDGLDCSSGRRVDDGRLGWYPIRVEQLNNPTYTLA
ncbi:hypothetical protein Gpo141_00010619 [Globisporangium polare]